MNDISENNWYPALLIGLGGTGVRAIRFFRYIVETDETGELREMAARNAIRFVGIDSSDEANDKKELVTGRFDPHFTGQEAVASPHLPVIDDMIQMKTTEISEVVSEFRRNAFKHTVLEDKYPGIAPWFPKIIPGAEQDLTAEKTTRNGAGQWRILGRVGFFLNLKDIFPRLKDAADAVQNESKPHPLRIFIICSLAGGTGSGTFWDTAFLLRMQYPNAFISGLFLLPGAFDGMKNQFRSVHNGYAALKELAVLSTMRQTETLSVSYPLSSGVKEFVGIPGSEPVFDNVYIYNAFNPGSNSNSLGADTVMATCLRMAESALGLMRRDIGMKLGIAKDNPPNDMAGGQGRANIFATTACLPLSVEKPDHMARSFLSLLLEELRRETFSSDHWPKLPDVSVWSILFPSIAAAPVITLDAFAEALVARLPDCPVRLEKTRDGFTEGVKDAGILVHDFSTRRMSASELIQRCVGIYEKRVDEDIRNAWKEGVLEPSKPLTFCFGDSHKIYRDDLQVILKAIESDFEDTKKSIRQNIRPLSAPVLEKLKKLADALSGIGKNPGVAAARMPALAGELVKAEADPDVSHRPSHVLTLKAPTALLQMRTTLGLFDNKASGAQALKQAHDQHGAVGPIHLAIQMLMTKAEDSLKNILKLEPKFGGVLLARKRFAVKQFIIDSSNDLVKIIKAVIECSEEALRVVDRRALDIEACINNLTGRRIPPHEKRKRLAFALAPLADILARTPDPKVNPKELTAQVEGMVAIMCDIAKGGGGGSLADELRSGHLQNTHDKIFKAWSDLRQSVRAKSTGSILSQSKFDIISGIRGVVEAVTPIQHPLVDNSDEFEAGYLGNIEIVTRGIIRYWAGREEFLLARLGDISGLASRLEGHRATVFHNGKRENPGKQINIAIAYPRLGENAELSKTGKDKLTEGFKKAAAGVYIATPDPIIPSDHPIIFIEDLYRAGDEIIGADVLFDAYHKIIPVSRRRNYHIFAEAVDFPDLVTDIEKRMIVKCGNDACEYNIRLQSTSDIFCNGCGKPILNRCGNPDCKEWNLKDAIARTESGGHGHGHGEQDKPFSCPSCGKPIRSYWWYCSVSEHAHKPISTSRSACPLCEDENRNGRRAFRDIQRLKGGGGFDCPGCVNKNVEKPFRLHWALQPYFETGVTASDKDDFMKLIDAHKTPPYYCPNEKIGRHFLFPVFEGRGGNIEYIYAEKNDPAGQSIVWKGSGRENYHTLGACYHCGSPVHAAREEYGEHARKVKCPRCLRMLQFCQFCSPNDRMLFEGEIRSSIAPVCPRCTNLMWKVDRVTESSAAETSRHRNAGFCRNLFGCAAGAHPWHTASDRNMKKCLCCSPSLTQSDELLPHFNLKHYIETCPLCMVLVGLPKHGRVEKLSLEEVPQHFGALLEKDSQFIHRFCPVCFSRSGHVLKWMYENRFGMSVEEAGNEVQAAHLGRLLPTIGHVPESIPKMPASQVLQILVTMMEVSDDEKLYKSLRESRFIGSGSDGVDGLRIDIEGLFKPESLSYKNIHMRLVRVGALHREIHRAEVNEH